jgi:hypothetical protein
MKLLADDWKEILKRAWSVRLIILAGLLTGVEAVLPFFGKNVPGIQIFTLFVVAAALIARLLAQKNIK